MILIKLASNNVVIYAGCDLVLNAQCASSASGNWQDFNTTTANAVIDSGTPPVTWASGAYTFSNEVWAIANQVLIPVPQTVTAFQAKAALANANLYDAVNGYMTATTTPIIDQLAWSEAANFNRNDQIIASLMSAVNLTNAQLDSLFVAAAQINP